jgi:acyl phosphate:glycerol-3-phosphate acyltransferase
MVSPSDSASLAVPAAAIAAAGYLLGALPFGYIVARAHGVNIFEVGSKNPGATNVKRVLGKRAGNTVFALDAAKGAAAAAWPLLAVAVGVGHDGEGAMGAAARSVAALAYLGLAFAIIGHGFSCFTHFKGGKGVATAAGGMAVVLPLPTAAAGLVWVCTFYLSRYVSLASILAAVALPLVAAAMGASRVGIVVSSLVAAFVVVRHRGNISRLIAGTESRFERKKKEPSA